MSSRRQRSILLGGRSRQVSLYDKSMLPQPGATRYGLFWKPSSALILLSMKNFPAIAVISIYNGVPIWNDCLAPNTSKLNVIKFELCLKFLISLCEINCVQSRAIPSQIARFMNLAISGLIPIPVITEIYCTLNEAKCYSTSLINDTSTSVPSPSHSNFYNTRNVRNKDHNTQLTDPAKSIRIRTLYYYGTINKVIKHTQPIISSWCGPTASWQWWSW